MDAEAIIVADRIVREIRLRKHPDSEPVLRLELRVPTLDRSMDDEALEGLVERVSAGVADCNIEISPRVVRIADTWGVEHGR